MERPKCLKDIAWLVKVVEMRCLERDDITGFRVELWGDLGVRIAVDMGKHHMANLISFGELELSTTNVLAIVMDQLFADLRSYVREKESELKPGA